MENPLKIVKINEIRKIYKDGLEATNIEVVSFGMDSFVVAQKNLYSIGDEAFYIMPDYCLPDNELFANFTRPNNDPKKSKLGSNNRIRAIKFNLSFENQTNPIYSYGILMPLNCGLDLDNHGIFKYEPPTHTLNYGAKNEEKVLELPNIIAKSDEENVIKYLKHLLFPKKYSISKKMDGSSTTIFYCSDLENMSGICSRNCFFVDDKTVNIFKNEKTLKILENLRAFCIENDVKLALRGELCGLGIQNFKVNPDCKSEIDLYLYGVDIMTNSVFQRNPLSNKYNTKEMSKILGLKTCPVIFEGVINSLEELKEIVKNYFASNLVEGVVIRSFDDNSVSLKYMNLEYDSKK